MTPLVIARLRLALAPATALLLVACATNPTSIPELDEARTLYARASSDTSAVRSAPLELRRAQEALMQAETAIQSGQDQAVVIHYAYLARQRAATAIQAGDIMRADQEVAASGVERNRILMEARSREAEKSAAEAEKARVQAEKARVQADQARQQAEQARMQAEKDRQLAEEQLAAAEAAKAKVAKLQSQLAELEAKQTERGMVLTLGDVLFDTGRAELKSGAFSTIDRLSVFMRENPERTLSIEGYTDAVGSDTYNLNLSQRRADAVRAALAYRGIDGGRISAKGFGKANPVASNATAEGRQRNRRVEIVISNTQ